jgi:hypothetical protein
LDRPAAELLSAPALASFLAAHLLALAVLAATAWAAGSLACSKTPRTLSLEGRAEQLTMPAALGLAVLAHLGFLLGSLGLLRPGVLITVIVAVHCGGFKAWRTAFADLRIASGRKIAPGWIALGLLVLAPLFVLAIYPPTAFDEIMYHLPFARAFARSGGLPAMPALRFPVFPALGELLFAETLLLAGDVATHLVDLVAVLATAGLLVAWGRRAFSPKAGWIAAALYLGNPIVVYLAGTAYVDPLLALFVTGALFAAWVYLHSDRTDGQGWLLLAAAFAGSAAGVKYLGLFFAAAVFVDLAHGCRKLSIPILFALAAFVVLAPTHVRIAAHTGNPIFPYLPGIFGSTAWDPITIKPMADVIVPETLVRFVRLPWDVVFHRSAVGRQPPFSPFYLLGLPLLFAGAVRDSRVRRLMAIPLVWGIVFLCLPADARYLLPVLPAVSLALAGSILVSIPIEKRSLVAAVCALAFLPGWLYAGYRMALLGPPPVTAEERDLYLARKLPLYPAVRELDRISSVAYAFHAESMKYFHQGALYGDWIGEARYGRFLPLVETPAALHRELRRLGASHLLMSKSPGAVRPPGTSDWQRWFRRVYEDPAAAVFALAVKADADLSEVRSRFQVAQGRWYLVEAEHAVDHRLELVLRDGLAHRLEHLARPDEDAVQAYVLLDEPERLDAGARASQEPDHADRAAHADGVQRPGQVFRSDDFHDVIYSPLPGQVQSALVPVGRILVVDAVRGAQLMGPPKLFLAARGHDHVGADQPGKLQGEKGDAAGALHQHGVALLHTAAGDDGMPCRDSGQRQRRGLLIREVLRHLHHRVFAEDYKLGERSVRPRAAKRRRLQLLGRRLAIDPSGKEDAGDAVPGPEPGHSFADGHDLAHAVRSGNARRCRPPDALNDEEIPVVE